MTDLWVFGYGSLMWRPGFAPAETRRARLPGYRRALCVRSYVHRGTRERPGLVLGLDRGGSCIGLAFRVPTDLREALVGYLRELEEIAYSDAADFLQAIDDEVRHRSRKNSELTTAYARVLLLAQARGQAVAEGIARSRRDPKDPVPGEQPNTPQPG